MSRPLTAEAARAADETDERLIRAALASASGNVGAAAIALRVPRRTLDKRIAALGLRAWLTATYPRADRQPKRKA